MAKQGAVYTIPLGQRGMVTHLNRWLTTAGDLSVAQNVTFENDMVQKEPAAAHYDTTGLAIESPNGTFSGATDSTFAAIWLPMSASTTTATNIANLANNIASPVALTPLTGVAAGRLLAVAGGQRINKTDSPICTSVTDDAGNTYARQKQTAGSGAIDSNVEIWTSIVTNPLTVANLITLTFTTASADDRAITICSYTNVSSGTTEAVAAAAFDNVATFSSASNPYVGRSFPALLLATVHWPKINTTTATWLAGFTQNGIGSGPTFQTQTSLASKVVVFSTAIVAQV